MPLQARRKGAQRAKMPSQGFVSVFSPVGSSLLGLRVGCIARWRSLAGEPCATEVVAILFQPEDSSVYSLQPSCKGRERQCHNAAPRLRSAAARGDGSLQ